MKGGHRRNGLINRGDGGLRVESRFIRTASQPSAAQHAFDLAQATESERLK
jgi:hypothetical protein